MTYRISTPEAPEFEDFADARKAADEFTLANATEVKVVLLMADGETALAYHTSPRIVDGVVQGYFSPWTRVQPVPSTFQPPHIEGFTLAYKRETIQAGVYRADNKVDGWLVVTATERIVAANTKAACRVTSELLRDLRVAKAAAVAAAKAAEPVTV